MLKKGEYKVIDLLCISKPLLNQTYHEPKFFDVYKSVLEQNEIKYVVYFLDNIEIGQNSVIFIKQDLKNVILYKTMYRVVHQTHYRLNTALIEKLIKKLK